MALVKVWRRLVELLGEECGCDDCSRRRYRIRHLGTRARHGAGTLLAVIIEGVAIGAGIGLVWALMVR